MLAFFMALVLAGVFTWIVFKRLRASMGDRNSVKVVVAATELPAGVALAEKDVTLMDWPSDVPMAGTYSKAQEVLGHPLIRSLGAKEPIFQRDLGLEGSGVGLATKIPPGMRATAVKSNEIVGVAGFLYPGSHVDVQATIQLPANGGTLTQTVLQDVEVLTAGQTIEPDPQGKPQQVDVVTLLVSPEDSQKLQLASTQGTIQFVLRNGTDTTVNKDLRPARLDQLVDLPAKPVPLVRTRAAKPVAARPSYVLEVIEGTKKTVHKFDESVTKEPVAKVQGTE
jgi:pilus assembly protein CpaB